MIHFGRSRVYWCISSGTNMCILNWRSKIPILMKQKWDFTYRRIKMIVEREFYLCMEAVGWFAALVRLHLFILFLYWLHLEQKYLELTVEFKIIHVRIKLEMLPASLLFLLLGFLSGGLSIYSHVYFLRNIWFYRLVIYNVYLFSIQRHTITLFPKLQEDWMSWLFPSSKWT